MEGGYEGNFIQNKMASIIINSACNLKCPFCFATEIRSEVNDKKNDMSEEEFDKYLKFDSNIMTSLCGGEPTLHPQFVTFMEKVFSVRGKYINLLTNGLWNEEVCNYINNLDFDKAKRVMYLFNILEPQLYSEKQKEILHRSLSCVNPENTFVGFTIYKKDFDFGYIFDIANQYDIKRIRYSIAAPNITDHKSWNVDPQNDFKSLANIVYNFVMEATERGFEVNADCGYLPPCAYSKEQLADLLLVKRGVKFQCNSVGDIGKGGNTWRCYGCHSAINSPIDRFKNVREMQDFYQKESELLLGIDLFEECKECSYKKREICNGGCLTYRIIYMMKNKQKIKFKYMQDNDEFKKLIPSINRNVLQIWNRKPDEKYIYSRKKDKMQVFQYKDTYKIDKILKLINGKRSVAEIIMMLYDDSDKNEEVIEIIKQLYQNDALKMEIKINDN